MPLASAGRLRSRCLRVLSVTVLLAAMATEGSAWTGESSDYTGSRQLLRRHRDDAGRRKTRSEDANGISGGSSGEGYKHATMTDWDGQRSWEWDNPRTLYFEPVAGLGNRLRALASAVVVAREVGVGLKVIWREEVECGDDCGHMPPFNSTWPDLFSEPKLRLAPNFPGSNYSVHKENVWLKVNMSIINPDMPPVIPGFNCNVHIAESYMHLKQLLADSWTHVHGEQVLCVKSDLWLTKNGEQDGKFFFRLLKPSPSVKYMVDSFKRKMGWDDQHWVGVHIRRTDLHLTSPDGQKKKMESLISLAKYVDAMRKLAGMTPTGDTNLRFFVATDDLEAEKIVKSSFGEGMVQTFPKTAWSRSTVEGIQQALVDVLLLSDCPVLIGTYYSSYSEMAKLIGWPFYIQIGQELKSMSKETVFEGLNATSQADATSSTHH